MSKVNKNFLILAIAMVTIIISLQTLLNGGFSALFRGDGYKAMLLQLAIWCMIALFGIKKRNVLWIISLLVVFCYLHMMFIPMFAAILYTVLTLLIGRFMNYYILKYKEKELLLLEYFLGMMLLTILYAALSVVKLGSITNIRIVCGILFVILMVWVLRTKQYQCGDIFARCIVSKSMYLKWVMVMCFLMITIGRANLSIDYDSMWYGLRAPFVLSNATGIYENLKLVGCVYTYPKGYEIYQLPLSSSVSYGYMYAGNIIMFLMLLYVTYRICRRFLDVKGSMWGVVLIAAIPGISNMAITAKPDIMTLLIQMMCILFGLLFVEERKDVYLGGVVTTYIYSQTLKPTAIVFSTSILILVVFICVAYRIKLRYGKSSRILTAITLVDLLVIWIRTYIMTGIPATSVWGKIFRALGMKDKYPFASGQISQFRSGGVFSEEVISATIQRMKEFFFAPNSVDTDHIIIAWGSVFCTFVVVLVIFSALCNMKQLFIKIRESAVTGFLALLFLGELAGCLMSLWLLTKPDGNYFMLFYASTIIVGVIFVEKMLINKKNYSRGIITGIWTSFVFINICMTGMTNWSWINKFCDINWINRGFYNHQLEYKTELKKSGCEGIYDIITELPDNHVLAFALHPQIERIPCVIESELDVNFWGNQELMLNQENFLKFVNYVNYDYIMVWNDYVLDETIPFYNLSALFDCGRVEKVLVENGHILLKLGDSTSKEQSSTMKEVFETAIRDIQ